MIKKEAANFPKYEDLTREVQRMLHVKNENDTGNDGGDWNRLKIFQKMPEQRTGKTRNQGTTGKSHIGNLHTYSGK